MLELNSKLRENYLEPRGIAHRSRTGDHSDGSRCVHRHHVQEREAASGRACSPVVALLPDGFDCRKAPRYRTAVSRGEVHVKVFGGAEVVGIGAAAKPAVGTIE